MEIDISKLKYKFLVILKSGASINITNLILDCSLEDPDGEISEHAEMTINNILYGSGRISSVITPGSALYVYSDWGSGFQEIYRGTIWDWDDEGSTTDKSFAFSAYDILKYLESEDNIYFPAGLSTKSIVGNISNKWGISFSYTYSSITHSKIVLPATALSEAIISVLNDAQSKVDSNYVVLARKGIMDVIPQGSNSTVCIFTGREIETTSNKRSMDDLITKVIVGGQQDNAGKVPVEATFTGRTEFGTLQKIVSRDEDTTLSAASAEAKKMLKESGNLSEDREIGAPDVPFIRKGDKVKIVTGSFNGYYYVLGVTHLPVERRMTMQVKSVTQESVPIKSATK